MTYLTYPRRLARSAAMVAAGGKRDAAWLDSLARRMERVAATLPGAGEAAAPDASEWGEPHMRRTSARSARW